jgi:hypothetical protein
MYFQLALVTAYILIGLLTADRKIIKYAKATAQGKRILQVSEGIKTKLDLILFYIALVVFWPLHIGRSR